MIPDIILIGPIRAGKSTLGALLAEKLGVTQVSSDELCWDYYKEIGFIREDARCRGSDGMIASRFNVHAVERLLADHRNCVIDLGAGHSVYGDEASLARVQNTLAPYPNVILILPSPDLDESSAILRERNAQNEWLTTFRKQNGYDPNEHFLRHPANFTLAKFVVYTKGKTPEETRDEILARVKYKPKRSMRRALNRQQEEIVRMLAKTLEEAKAGRIRSLVLISIKADGGSGCWARINREEDNTIASGYLESLKRDLSTK